MSEPRVRRALCPGSFDPVTNGHLDVFTRAAAHFDEVVVAVFENSSKSHLFSVEERMDLLRSATADIANLRVDSFHGLVVDFCRANDLHVIVKGLRAVSDFDYEFQMAQANYKLAEVETFFVSTSPAYGYLSSSLVKDIARRGGDISGWVPATVESAIKERVHDRA